jgi:hypothetical protein
MNPSNHAVHQHYKKIFGVPRRVGGFDLESLKLDVAVFDDTPCEEATTFATVGLSPTIGQELLLSCYTRQATAKTTKLLGVIAEQLFQGKAGVRRGQVLGPAGPVEDGALVEAFYVCPPVYYPTELEPLDTAQHHVHFFWLVPIHAAEATWIRAHEDEQFRFENLLQAQDPDLLDLCREPIQLPTK